MRARLRLASTIALGCALAGCGDDDVPAPGALATAPPPAAGACDLVPPYCLLPFPSDQHLEVDAAMPAGRSVRIDPARMPQSSGVAPIDPALLQDRDGFSPGQAALTYLPGATATGLATPGSIERSLQADSPTVLIDVERGERVPHWVDLDAGAEADDERAFAIRPALRLRDDARYAVAIRSVVDATGAVIPPSAAFAALRDGSATTDPRRAMFEAVFGELAQAGVARSDLQMAWGFTTATRDNTTSAILRMRDDALASVGEDGPSYVVKSVEEHPAEGILRRIVLTMTVPLYLDRATLWQEGESPPRLHLGADGLPAQNGTMQLDVLVHVPESTLGGAKHGLLQNGHGLFGRKEEGQGGYLAEIARSYGWIAFATDLFGFRSEDVEVVLSAVTVEPKLFRSFVERQMQGHVAQLLAMRMMTGRVAKQGIQASDGTMLLDPAAIDPALRAYRGDSQGGIMGGTYMALTTDVPRGLLGEPGLPYSLLLDRSVDFDGFDVLLRVMYSNSLDRQLIVSLVQMMWDRSEPTGYAPYIAHDPLPGTPEHDVLIHAAIGDHQVSTLGAHILARAIGAKNLEPINRPVFGLDTATAPIEGNSVLVEYEFGLSEPATNIPTVDGCDPHDRVRVLTPSYQQQDHFFRTGIVDAYCDGPCNCDAPGEEEGCLKSTCE